MCLVVQGYQAITCATYNRSYEDMRVPGHEKIKFLVRDFGYVCLFWPLKSKQFYLFDIYLSERFSRELGHEPMKDFEKAAWKIFQSVRFLGDKLEKKTR